MTLYFIMSVARSAQVLMTRLDVKNDLTEITRCIESFETQLHKTYDDITLIKVVVTNKETEHANAA